MQVIIPDMRGLHGCFLSLPARRRARGRSLVVQATRMPSLRGTANRRPLCRDSMGAYYYSATTYYTVREMDCPLSECLPLQWLSSKESSTGARNHVGSHGTRLNSVSLGVAAICERGDLAGVSSSPSVAGPQTTLTAKPMRPRAVFWPQTSHITFHLFRLPFDTGNTRVLLSHRRTQSGKKRRWRTPGPVRLIRRPPRDRGRETCLLRT